jgi:hypothetical protein
MPPSLLFVNNESDVGKNLGTGTLAGALGGFAGQLSENMASSFIEHSATTQAFDEAISVMSEVVGAATEEGLNMTLSDDNMCSQEGSSNE